MYSTKIIQKSQDYSPEPIHIKSPLPLSTSPAAMATTPKPSMMAYAPYQTNLHHICKAHQCMSHWPNSMTTNGGVTPTQRKYHSTSCASSQKCQLPKNQRQFCRGESGRQ